MQRPLVHWSPALPALSELPFAIGKSPFHIKGVAYRGAKAQYNRLVPGGVDALAKHVGGLSAGFLTQDFFESVFYDILPLAYFDLEAARLCDRPADVFVAETMRMQFEHDARIYGAFLRFMPTASVLKKLVVLSAQYVNFGRATLEERADRWFDVCHHGCPAWIASWYAACSAGYATAALQKSGAQEIELQGIHTTPAEDGLVNASWGIRWAPSALAS